MKPHSSQIKLYFPDKELIRFTAFEAKKHTHITFYLDGIISMLNCFDKYEIYSNEIMIEKYEKKQKLAQEEKKPFDSLFLLFKANEITQGHERIIHGGFITTVVDHLMGRVAEMAADGDGVATANLTFNFRKPILVCNDYLMEISFEKIEKERKIYVNGKVFNEKFEIYLEATALFLKVKW